MHDQTRVELVGGPHDGERRTVAAGLSRMVTTAPASIARHVYVRCEDGRFHYDGCEGPSKTPMAGEEYRNEDV